MYMKTKKLGLKQNCGIQNIGIEDSKGNIMLDNRKILKIWGNYVAELYVWPTRPENLEVETGEEVGADEKCPNILQSEVWRANKEMKD
jgi:hypothetical protein